MTKPGLPDLPANAALMDYLRSRAVLGREGDPYNLGPWELHTHPDLIERLSTLAPRWPVLPAYGVPVLAFADIAAVVALGMDVLLVRLPQIPPDLEPADPVPPLTDLDWRSVDAWQSALTSAESLRLLSGVVKGALDNAKDLARATRPSPRSPGA